LKALKI